jgi:hypothetical protein
MAYPSELRELKIKGTSGNIADVNSDGQLHVVAEGHVCSCNSTTTPLLADAVWTGESENILAYNGISLFVTSDVASATAGIEIQYSKDGESNWRTAEAYTLVAGAEKWFTPPAFGGYLRIKYTNGGSDQTTFELTTTLRKMPFKWSSHNIDNPIVGADDAELVKSVITGKKDNGDFDNASLTNKGHFKVAVEEYGDTPSVDAFARLRVSENYTIFDSKQLHDKQPLFWDEKVGGSATSTHVPTNADVEMIVTASSSDYVIRQTKQRFNYQPGKSQLIFMTFRSPQSNGVTSRIGCFDDDGTGDNLTPNNGIFFKCDGDLTWNIAKNGATTETATQANWNVDTLDGSGDSGNPSGLTLDTDATQILIIDYEWLGVGRVRVGFVIDGLIRYVHYFNHANNDTYTSVYMSTPNLPLRYDIQTDGTSAGELDHICSSVISEGGIEKTGILRSVDTGTAHIDVDADQPTFVVGIRLKDTYKDITVIPEFLSMINENNDDFRWSVCLNPTYTGTVTWSDLSNSAVQVGIGATADNVSDYGIEVAVGYASVDTLSVNQQLQTALRIGSAIDGTKDELALVVNPLSNGADIQGSLNFRELL